MSPTSFAQDRPLCVIKEEIKTSNVNSIAYQGIKIEDKSFVDTEDINSSKQLTNSKTSQFNKENKTVTANYTEYDDISKTFSLKEVYSFKISSISESSGGLNLVISIIYLSPLLAVAVISEPLLLLNTSVKISLGISDEYLLTPTKDSFVT